MRWLYRSESSFRSISCISLRESERVVGSGKECMRVAGASCVGRARDQNRNRLDGERNRSWPNGGQLQAGRGMVGARCLYQAWAHRLPPISCRAGGPDLGSFQAWNEAWKIGARWQITPASGGPRRPRVLLALSRALAGETGARSLSQGSLLVATAVRPRARLPVVLSSVVGRGGRQLQTRSTADGRPLPPHPRRLPVAHRIGESLPNRCVASQ